MKKNVLLILVSLSCFMAAETQAQEWYENEFCCYEDNCCIDETNFYAKVFGGANFLQSTEIGENRSSYQTGCIIAGSLGYCYCYGFCLEAEYAFRKNAISKIHFFGEGSSEHGHFQTSSYMINLLWNVPLSLCGCEFWNIQPLIGVGLGYDSQRMHSSNSRIIFNQKWHHLSWQIMAGLSYPIFCNTEVTLEYRFHQGSRHFYNHSLGAGIVYKFL